MKATDVALCRKNYNKLIENSNNYLYSGIIKTDWTIIKDVKTWHCVIVMPNKKNKSVSKTAFGEHILSECKLLERVREVYNNYKP